ncbi:MULTISPECIES: hypothetical protein [Streptomyces]|uniref:hypothetical protein n=1 Tax=Streptomyces TaxID=1883 RepID=UPI00163BD36E|nr:MULTISPECIES: hypothetical protein [Streptomyces]MBC2875038.1 hypothetical protein [Streptomyces sp. TYQ1024]UBI37472.1 hypothetical protein K7I03_14025 [Streptomyces mobaraensis]UKW30062.1 hypothetical protein MCU78_13990 [Streptomyces sp. TYQ1024]
MAVHGHGRGAAVATAVAGGLALGLLVTGCAEIKPGEEARDALGGGHGGVLRAVRTADEARPGRAADALRGVREALAAAGGARVRTVMETESGGTRLTIRGAGVYDFARPAGRLTVLVPEDARGDAEHRPITEVFTPGALYMKNRGAGVPADKWVRLETGTLADGDLLTSGATDPLAAAELLGGAREVTCARDEGVDGVPVRHCRGKVDLTEAARRAPARDRAALAAAAKGFSSGAVDFDAFLDDAGRARVLRYRFSVREDAERGKARRGETERGKGAEGGTSPGRTAAPAAGAPMTVVSTVELTSFGFAPDIRLPAPADIYAGTVASPRK